MQSVENPAKLAYSKFDVLAKTMKVQNESTIKEKDVNVKGLLKRLKKTTKNNKEDKEEQQPVEIALDYFMAIRRQREQLKQEV